MKRLATGFILTFVAFNSPSLAQDNAKYAALIKEAWSLYEAKEYLRSARTYSDAFVALGGRGMVNDRYNAACSWALANQPDSAFTQLFRIAQKANYTNIAHISNDPDLNSLHENKRWSVLLEIIKSNKEKAEVNFDKPLVVLLDTVYQDDQKYRQQLKEIETKYGWESDEMKAHWKIINEKDSINLIKVTKILDERGWLGADVIGQRGNSTLFLVVQHADLAVQEKYLPVMREAVKKGNANSSSLALLEDRVALRNGQKQIYGSQVMRDQDGTFYVMPLIDPDNVDKRRAEMGLGPIQDYISNWGMTWDVEAYKKKLPEYEEKQRRSN